MQVPRTSSPRIMIVDHKASGRAALSALLLGDGYDLAFASSGSDLLTRLEQFGPDTILLDVTVPDTDGYEICQRLKASEQWQYVPVILITALDQPEALTRGLAAGADEFLPKSLNGPELRARVRSMLRIKKQCDQLKEALQLRESLINMIVHDIRDPLTAILAFSDFLGQSLTDPGDRDDIENIHSAALRLNSFLNDLLMLAKMQEGKLALNLSTVHLDQLVLTTVEHYRAIARSQGIDLVAELPERSAAIQVDASLFHRVLQNLVSSALKFSSPGGRVTLRVQDAVSAEARSRHLTRIQILDQGPRMSWEHRDRVLDGSEVTMSNGRPVSQLGLGLAFCKMVVEAHGGRIYVEPNQPRGSIFTVELRVDA